MNDPQCRQQKWTYLAMRSRVKSSICPVILRPAKNCKFLTAFSICWCDRILSAKFDLGRQPNCIRQSSTFLLQSIIELTTCLNEFPEHESKNFFTNVSQFLIARSTQRVFVVDVFDVFDSWLFPYVQTFSIFQLDLIDYVKLKIQKWENEVDKTKVAKLLSC